MGRKLPLVLWTAKSHSAVLRRRQSLEVLMVGITWAEDDPIMTKSRLRRVSKENHSVVLPSLLMGLISWQVVSRKRSASTVQRGISFSGNSKSHKTSPLTAWTWELIISFGVWSKVSVVFSLILFNFEGIHSPSQIDRIWEPRPFGRARGRWRRNSAGCPKRWHVLSFHEAWSPRLFPSIFPHGRILDCDNHGRAPSLCSRIKASIHALRLGWVGNSSKHSSSSEPTGIWQR